MDTIRNYLDSMFTGLGNNADIKRAKEELLSMMEDKYNELISQGHSENAAIGQVIAEFGNLEELADVLGIQEQMDGKEELMVIDSQLAEEVLSLYEKKYPKFAYGTLTIFVGTIIFLTIVGLADTRAFTMLSEEAMVGIGLMILLFFVAIAVYIFIMTFGDFQPYEYLEKEPFQLTQTTQRLVENKVKEKARGRQSQVALSILVFIFSAIPLVLTGLIESVIPIYVACIVHLIFVVLLKQVKLLVLYIPLTVGLSAILYTFGYSPIFAPVMTIIMVSLGVFSLLEGNGLSQGSNILLQKEEYSLKKKTNKLSETFSGIYWILVTGIYLSWSFITNNWHYTWIIWLIAGLLFSAINMYLDYRAEKNN